MKDFKAGEGSRKSTHQFRSLVCFIVQQECVTNSSNKLTILVSWCEIILSLTVAMASA